MGKTITIVNEVFRKMDFVGYLDAQQGTELELQLVDVFEADELQEEFVLKIQEVSEVGVTLYELAHTFDGHEGYYAVVTQGGQGWKPTEEMQTLDGSGTIFREFSALSMADEMIEWLRQEGYPIDGEGSDVNYDAKGTHHACMYYRQGGADIYVVLEFGYGFVLIRNRVQA